MKRKPRIGITAEYYFKPNDSVSHGSIQLPWNYAEMVHEVGGNPIILPATTDVESISEIIDGWLIPGNPEDMNANLYGEENHRLSVPQHPMRYEFESQLFAALPKQLPILGVCYGSQFLNVYHGGSLHQHLPDLLDHDDHNNGAFQEYRIVKGSRLQGIMKKDSIFGVCYHHQAVHKIGDGLRVGAYHQDGTIEAIEGSGDRWMIGFQWHPERAPDLDDSRRIFEAFIEEACCFSAKSVT